MVQNPSYSSLGQVAIEFNFLLILIIMKGFQGLGHDLPRGERRTLSKRSVKLSKKLASENGYRECLL